MYALSLRKLHVLSKSINLIEHHTFITIFVGIATLWLVSALLAPSDRQMFTQHAQTLAVSAQRPLTLLDDPQYAHEYGTRAQYINECLKKLWNETRADRAYVVSYKYGPDPFGNAPGLKISKTFEVGLTGLAPQLSNFQNFLRVNWLDLMRDNQPIGGLVGILFPRKLVMELEDGQGKPIGYLGIEYLQEKASLRGNERELLQQTAALIEAGLMQPIAQLNNMVQR
jgi:hypothetical protein